MKFTRDEMIKFLNEGICHVKFQKVDGTIRVMHGTLKDSKIPTDQRPTSESARKQPDSAIRLFDTDLQAWRSFRVDSVQDFVPNSNA